MTVPGALPYAEVERHIIRLPSGRLLVAAIYVNPGPDGKPPAGHEELNAVFSSDDDGRSWQVLARVPRHPSVVGECAMLRTASGKILIISRSENRLGQGWMNHGMLLQAESHDDGRTWSPWQTTQMSSDSSPGHLLQLQDGRILCSHASRKHPGSIYVTMSCDEGQTWDTADTRLVMNDLANWDSCYPNSGQLADGTVITVWYANLFGKFFLAAFLWRPEQIA
jgi:Neuraminidase (sialidase)